MNFSGSGLEALVYFGDGKMFLNGVLYKINVVSVKNSAKYCRFTFGDNQAKIYNDMLTLYMDGVTKTLILKNSETEINLSKKYLISPGKYLIIDEENKTINVDEKNIKVISKKKQGAYTLYDTEEGDLYISSESSRSSRWKNCSIFLTE